MKYVCLFGAPKTTNGQFHNHTVVRMGCVPSPALPDTGKGMSKDRGHSFDGWPPLCIQPKSTVTHVLPKEHCLPQLHARHVFSSQ